MSNGEVGIPRILKYVSETHGKKVEVVSDFDVTI